MVSITSNKTSFDAAAVDADTTKREEAGRIVMLPVFMSNTQVRMLYVGRLHNGTQDQS